MKVKFTFFLAGCFWLQALIACAGIDNKKGSEGTLPFNSVVGGSVDSAMINKLNHTAESYFQINPDTSLYVAEKAIALSKKINYQSGIANALLIAGHVSYFEGDPVTAGKKLNEAIAIYKRLNDKVGLTRAYIAYGRMQNLFANYDQAFLYFNEAIKLTQQTHDELTLADCYKNIGSGYFSQGITSKALDYYYKGLFIANKNHYRVLTGELYNDIGSVLQNMEVYPNALHYFCKALQIFKTTKNVLAIAVVNENIGEVLLNEGLYGEAISHLNGTVKMARMQNDKDGLSSAYADLGLCYAHKNELQRSISYLDTSLHVASKYKITYNEAYALVGFATVLNIQKNYSKALGYEVKGEELALKLGNLSVRANMALQLSETMSGLKQYEKAYHYLSEYNALKKRLKDNETIEKLTYYNFELNYATKENEFKEQRLLYEQKNRNQHFINAIFIIVIIAMVIALGIYYNAKRKQQRINAILALRNAEIMSQKSSLDEQATKLHELNSLKDRLISILAHDLRAPLSTLRGLFGLLLDKTISPDEVLQMIPDVLKRLEYTSDFLDTLLFWINSQMENFELAVKRFVLRDAIFYDLENYKEQASSKGIEFTIDVPEDITAIADPNSIRIVVRNLVTNAIKFTGDNGCISVSAQLSNDSEVLIKVKDTGTGMCDDRLNRLFKSKVDSKRGTKNESGTGLGLFLCKDLVEKCSGRIWAESQEGAGTEFAFTIPAVVNAEAPQLV